MTDCICENGFFIERTERVLRIEICNLCDKREAAFDYLENIIREYAAQNSFVRAVLEKNKQGKL